MNNITKRRTLIVAICCLIMLFTFSGCNSKREYNDDIHIQLTEHSGEIVIREWSYLLGSGAEVYYKDEGKEVLLENLLGGDDGFCPFKEGLYAVSVEDNKLTVEWCRLPNSDRDSWEKKILDIPTE